MSKYCNRIQASEEMTPRDSQAKESESKDGDKSCAEQWSVKQEYRVLYRWDLGCPKTVQLPRDITELWRDLICVSY